MTAQSDPMRMPTRDGSQLVTEWLRARDAYEAAREVLYRRGSEQQEAEKALVAWLLPPVIKPQPGEKICIWVGDSLLQVEVGGVITPGGEGASGSVSSATLTVRYRGAEFERLKQ